MGRREPSKLMAITSRRKRPLNRSVSVRDARLIIVATEGEKTEPAYFEAFSSYRIKIRTIPCSNGESSPRAVLDRIRHFRAEFDLGDDDEMWLVIDRDRWEDKMLSEVAQQCTAGRFNLALSNPCFEVWLALHYTDTIPEDLESKTASQFFSTLHGGYNKGRLDATPLIPLVGDAIAHAERLDLNPQARWPDTVGSRVYRLAKVILPFLD